MQSTGRPSNVHAGTADPDAHRASARGGGKPLDAPERLTIPGFLAWPSYERSGAMLAASLVGNDGQGPSRVLLYAPSGDLLLDLGEGDFPEFQP